jgi:hypothetical protein
LTLDQASDELLDASHDQIDSGYKQLTGDSGVCIIGDLHSNTGNSGEVLGASNVTDDGGGNWTIDDLKGGLANTSIAGQPSGSDFVHVSQGQLLTVNVPDEDVGSVYVVEVGPPGFDPALTSSYQVKIAPPVSPWNAPPTDSDRIDLTCYDWTPGTDAQNVTATPHWAAGSDPSKLGMGIEWQTSGNNGVSWADQGWGPDLVSSLTAGTVKFRCRAWGTDGTAGAWIESVNHAYEAPPSGGGGGGSSSRGTRILFSETGTPAGITGTGEQFFSSHFSIPGGMPLLGQVYKWVMWGTVSPSHDYTLRQYLGGVEIATTADPVAISNAGLTDFMAEIEMTILADGVGGMVRTSGKMMLFNDAGDKDEVPFKGADTAIDFSVAEDCKTSLEWTAAGRTMTVDTAYLLLMDTLGAGGSYARVYGEIPPDTIDGVNDTFTAAVPFVANSEVVRVGPGAGAVALRGVHYNASPTTGEIVFTAGNLPKVDDGISDVVVIDYDPA